jgi:hypothetical protein
MSKRDEYVERAKKRLDDWNSDIKKLEDAYEKAESGARLRLNEQIESLRRHREEVQKQIQRIEDAAEEVWHEIARGAEEAWRLIGDSFAGHRSSQREKPAQEKSSEEKPAARTSPAKKATTKKSPKKSTAESA